MALLQLVLKWLGVAEAVIQDILALVSAHTGHPVPTANPALVGGKPPAK
jgi:hypothetical protein